MDERLFLEGGIQSIGWALIHFIWQGALIGMTTAIGLRVVADARSNTRYAIACAGLGFLLAAPLLTATWNFAEVSPVAPSSAPQVVAEVRTAPAPTTMSRANGTAGTGSAFMAMDRLLPAAVVVWMSGVLLMSLRLVAGWFGIARLKRRAAPAVRAVNDRVAELSHLLGITRAVRVLESSVVAVPAVIGWLRPVILFPASALSGLAPAHLDAILTHELAHIRRHDYLVNAAQAVVETLLFYHPAVWWCSRQVRIEREHCCDDIAVTICGNRLAYATALTRLEELRMPNAIFAMSATGGRLVDRVRRVLGAPEPRGSQRGSVAAAILILVLSIAAATTFVRGAAAGTGRHRNTTADAVSPASRASGQDAATPAAPISRSAPARSEPSTSAAPTPAASPDGATVAQSDARRHVALLDDGSAEWRDSAGWLTIRRRGRIVLSDDDMDIVRMDPGAHFILSEGISWLPGFLQDLLTTRRILEFRGRADGSIQRQFRVGGQPHAYQPEGAAWLREMLPRIAPRMTETIALAGERQRAIAALNAGPQAQATPPNDAALADQEAIRRALVEAQAQIAKLRSQLPSAAGNAERMQKQLIAASAQLRAQSDLAQLLAEIERMRTELAVREASLSAQQRELDALRKAIEDLRTAMERGGSNAR